MMLIQKIILNGIWQKNTSLNVVLLMLCIVFQGRKSSVSNINSNLCNVRVPHTDLQVLSIKGQRATDQRVEDHPQAPHVHLGPIVLFALEEFGGCVGRGAAERVQLVPQCELITEAKVGYFDVHVCIQQQVLRLETEEIGVWE